MALEGTLEDFSLADIFQLIALQRKSGILSLKRDQEAVNVKFHNGMVIGADTSPKKLEDRIGKVLEKTGLITEDQLREALEYQQKTMQKIGFILVDQNYITREQLQEALQIQVAQMLYRLFRWHKGEYYFDQKARVDLESDENIPPMSAESILMEGIQMIDEWPIIEKRIPNFNMVFRPTIELSDIDLSDLAAEDAEFEAAFAKVNAYAPAGADSGEKIRLSREEAEVFLLLDGKGTVTDVVESSKLGEFHTCKALYDLLERKIIEPVSPRQEVRAPSLSPLSPAVEVAGPELIEEPAEERSLVPVYAVLGVFLLGFLALNVKDPLKLTVLPFFAQSGTDTLKRTASLTRMQAVDSAVLLYFHLIGTLPEKLEDLVQQNCITPDQLVDPWSRPYEYQVQEDAYILAGHTSDGSPDDGLQIERMVTPTIAKAGPKRQN